MGQFGWREGARPYSLMMANYDSAWTETGAEEGSPVDGAGEVDT
jgi:hypothetical protein